MIVESVSLHPISIPLRGEFVHALGARAATEPVIVELQGDSQRRGWGEILPRPYLTGETVESCLIEHAPRLAERSVGATFESVEDVLGFLAEALVAMGRNLATLAGFELALLDLTSRELCFDVPTALGYRPGPELPAGVVIGFEVTDEDLPRHCALLRMNGKRHVKVKVGREGDLGRLQTIFEILGGSADIRIDANGAWSPDAAVANLLDMRRFAIRSVEQPVAATDLSGMHRVRKETGLRVTADESLCSLDDAHRLIEADAVDTFNIRIAKCGGLLPSRDLIELARREGLECHLGTLVGETGILSGAAELLGRSAGVFEYLEGKGQNRFLLGSDIVESDGEAEDDRRAGGLGYTILRDRLEEFRVSKTTTVRRGIMPPLADSDQERIQYMSAEEIQKATLDYIQSRLMNNRDTDLTIHSDLVGGGLLDSVAMVELIVWIEDRYEFRVNIEDLTPEVFGTVELIAEYVAKHSGLEG